MIRRDFLLGSLGIPALIEAAARKAPEFTINLVSGKQLLLSHYRGKVVAIEFLFTTCPHCQHSAQVMSRFQNEYGPRGFQPLGVAFNEMAPMLVGDFVRMFNVHFPVGVSARDPVLKFLQISETERMVVPQLVLIDRQGVIRYQSPPSGDKEFYEEKVLRTRIEELLKEPAPRAKR
jgi:peroxiredoxin